MSEKKNGTYCLFEIGIIYILRQTSITFLRWEAIARWNCGSLAVLNTMLGISKNNENKRYKIGSTNAGKLRMDTRELGLLRHNLQNLEWTK